MASAKRRSQPKGHRSTSRRKPRRWVAGVKTESTYPEKGLFTKSATAIAIALASKKVSPKGPASGMRMLNYYINRGGKNLTADRRAVLEKAKVLLSKEIAKSHKVAKH